MNSDGTDTIACVECGAPLPDSGECWSRVHELLEVEARLAGLKPEAAKRAHFFAVATYQLQHPSRSTSDALTHLRERVDEMAGPDPRPIEPMRRQVGRLLNKIKVARKADPSDRTHVDRRWPSDWTLTPVDVIEAPDHEYPERVAAWAPSDAGRPRGRHATPLMVVR